MLCVPGRGRCHLGTVEWRSKGWSLPDSVTQTRYLAEANALKSTFEEQLTLWKSAPSVGRHFPSKDSTTALGNLC